MSNFILVAGQVAVLFLLTGVGFAARKAKLLDELSIGGLVNLLLVIVNPCLIVNAFNRPFDTSMLRGLAIAFAFAAGMHLLLMAVSRLAFARGPENTTVVLKLSSVFSNAGFMGIPLEQALLGPEGVFYGVAYIVVFNLFIWSWGLGLSRDGRFSLSRRMLANPGLAGIAAGLAVFLSPWGLPKVLDETLGSIASLNTPLAMAVIGYYLAGAKFGAALRSPAAHLAAAIRLLACPAAAVAALYPFRGSLDGTLMMAMVIPCAAPVAAMVSMFAAKHGRDVDMSVAMVSYTTLLSMATIPVSVAFAMGVLTAR